MNTEDTTSVCTAVTSLDRLASAHYIRDALFEAAFVMPVLHSE